MLRQTTRTPKPQVPRQQVLLGCIRDSGGEFVDANVGSRLGEDVELRGVEPFGALTMLSLLFGLRSQPKVMRNIRGMARVSIWSPVMRPYPF
jgi:hypothetical protein